MSQRNKMFSLFGSTAPQLEGQKVHVVLVFFIGWYEKQRITPHLSFNLFIPLLSLYSAAETSNLEQIHLHPHLPPAYSVTFRPVRRLQCAECCMEPSIKHKQNNRIYTSCCVRLSQAAPQSRCIRPSDPVICHDVSDYTMNLEIKLDCSTEFDSLYQTN